MWKTKNHLGFGFQKIKLCKNLTSVHIICPTETVCNPQFKFLKNNFTRIHCAYKERVKHCWNTEL